jgi:tetratricopeptide (TPR) repeat protein
MHKAALGMLAVLGVAAWGQGAPGQTAPQGNAPTGDHATAYYYYTLGHMYAELAGESGDRSYIPKAIENYKAAIKADPQSAEISEELTELYVQTGRLREAQTDAEEALRANPNDLGALRQLARIFTQQIGDGSRGARIDEAMLQKAIEQFQKITVLAPMDVDSWIMLAQLEKAAQNSAESVKAYKKALEVDPDNADALTGLAIAYSDLGDAQSAADVLKKLAEKNPSARSLEALAETYRQLRQYGMAADALRRALILNPPNAGEIKRSLAETLVAAGRYPEAIQTYQELAADDPNDFEAYLSISQIYIRQRDFVKATEASDMARKIDPSNLKVRYNDVSILESQDKLPQAIQALKDILTSTTKRTYTPDEKKARVALLDHLGGMYRTADQPDLAAETYRQLVDVDSELGPNVGVEIIETYIDARQLNKAQTEADADLKKWPDDRELHVEHARLLADMGKNDQAAAEVKKLLDGKSDFEIYLSLGDIYDKGKKFDEWAKALDAAEKLAERTDEKERVWFMRGAMFERMKKLEPAEAEFRKVLDVDPDYAGALNYLGYMLADRNIRLQESLDLITKALDRDPENGAYLDSLGWVLFRLGRFPEAEENMRRAVNKTPRDPTVHDHMAEVLMAESKVKEAVAQWQTSLKEWDASPPADLDPAEEAKVKTKLENARVRLAKETTPAKR